MVAQKSFLITVHKVKISKTEKANLEGKKLFVAVSDDDSFQVSEPMPADKLGWKKVLGLMVDGTTITLALKDAETKGVWASTTMDCSEVFDKQPVPVDGSIKVSCAVSVVGMASQSFDDRSFVRSLIQFIGNELTPRKGNSGRRRQEHPRDVGSSGGRRGGSRGGGRRGGSRRGGSRGGSRFLLRFLPLILFQFSFVSHSPTPIVFDFPLCVPSVTLRCSQVIMHE
eukprot:GHVU01053764.1.p1 GENE.GHVU01053764.1~~GHVU01053764.1.p1  ORF type:complete len:226 (+),score=42.29 GHVU01053764.1:21-698(+)